MYGKSDIKQMNFETINERSIANMIGIMQSPAWGRLGMELQENLIAVVTQYADMATKRAFADRELFPQENPNKGNDELNSMFR